jgi:2-haloacid dehalogenase
MKKYNTLLFDVDDTLLDFKKGEDIALKELFNEMNIDNIDRVIEIYKELNHSLWKDIEDGKLTRDYVLNNRFSILFDKFNIEVDGKNIEDRYRHFLNLQHECIEGSIELLEKLYKSYRLYIITNGVSETQHKRLRDSNLTKYFDKIFISENIGAQKPSMIFFEAVMKYIPDFDKDASLIIGDSLNADILGGINAGIDTCWFNPSMKENATDITPTYVIHKLKDLYEILSK